MDVKKYFSAALMTLSLYASAAPVYDSTQSYPAGSRVSLGGNVYEAKWWANPSQSPGANVVNRWDTPWKLISEGTDQAHQPQEPGRPSQPPGPSQPPQPPQPPQSSQPAVGSFPAYSEGGQYQGGELVTSNGKVYRCKAGITSPWCSGAAWAYKPGSGIAWQSAWELVSASDSGTSATGSKPESKPTKPATGTQVKKKPVTPPSKTTPKPKPPGTDVQYGNGQVIPLSVLNAKESALTDTALMRSVKKSIRTLDNASVERVRALSPQNPENVKRVESIISESTWNYLFPKRAPEYTYRHFLQAVAKFPALCGTYEDRDSDAICRKALATMFAHFTQETGGHTAGWDVPEWRQGLVHVREMGWTETMRGGYNSECNPSVWQGQTWPCGTFSDGQFKSYFGRGAKQLSYNYNYGPFSYAMFGDVRTLLDHPEMVADTWLNLASAIFFFIYPQPPKPSMLHVVDGTWQPNAADIRNHLTPGFGVTTQIINGGVECGGTVEVAQSLNRISYYKSFAVSLGVPVYSDEVLGCKGMRQFDSAGAGAMNIYWEKDWSWSAEYANGKSYACHLVGYQTPFSAFKQGDFVKCVRKYFPDVQITQ